MRLVTLTLIFASAGFAAAPDLTGNWKLNAAKSDFGQFPAPSSMSQKVTHAEPKLTVELKMGLDSGEFESKSNYTTDGKECTNNAGTESKSVLKWDGPTLLIETKGNFGGNAYTMKDKWTLSEDGKILTILRRFSSAMGDVDQKLILDKQ